METTKSGGPSLSLWFCQNGESWWRRLLGRRSTPYPSGDGGDVCLQSLLDDRMWTCAPGVERAARLCKYRASWRAALVSGPGRTPGAWGGGDAFDRAPSLALSPGLALWRAGETMKDGLEVNELVPEVKSSLKKVFARATPEARYSRYFPRVNRPLSGTALSVSFTRTETQLKILATKQICWFELKVRRLRRHLLIFIYCSNKRIHLLYDNWSVSSTINLGNRCWTFVDTK